LSKPRVALDVPFPAFLAELFEPHCELVPWPGVDDAPREDVEAVLSYTHVLVDEALLALVPNARVVSNYGVGYDHVDVAAAARRSVPVGNTPGVVDGATADLTMALLLAVARRIPEGDRFARGPDYAHVDPGRLLGRDVFGSTLGIVGLGAIGREVARRARGFGMRVLYHNRRRDEPAETELGVEYLELDALLASSDFVSLHVPLTAQTTGLVGARALGLMREGAFLVNVARGPVVDTEALVAALASGHLAGAALDVTDPEPLPRHHRLNTMDNVVQTPHVGTSTVDTRLKMGRMALANLLAGLEGRELPYAVPRHG
jgi:glyoxylate reductase